MVEMVVDVFYREFAPSANLASRGLRGFLIIIYLPFFDIRTDVTNQLLIFIKVLNPVAALMKTRIAWITVDNLIAGLIFRAETYFAISFKELVSRLRFFNVLGFVVVLISIGNCGGEVFACFVWVP